MKKQFRLKNPVQIISKVVQYGIIIGLSSFVLFPIIWLVITSVKVRSEIYISKLPSSISLLSYITVLKEYRLEKFFFNSIIIAMTTTILVVIIACLGGYGFSKFKYPISDKIFLICVLLRMLPFVTLMIPLYLVIAKLGLTNSKFALIIGNTAFNLPMGLWLMETFFRDFPDELLEASYIDGASNLKALINIALPISKPSISVVAILTFITTWNEFMFALVVTSDNSSQPLTVGISMLTQQYGVRWDLMSAASMIYIIPTLLIALMLQKYIISGLTLGAIKG